MGPQIGHGGQTHVKVAKTGIFLDCEVAIRAEVGKWPHQS